MQTCVKIMLDSGAFSAWKRGQQIDCDEYIRFVDKHEPLLHSYINLDVIPGTNSRRANQKEVDEAAGASHKNLQRMKKAGLDPMPVFHYGEEFKWLHRLADAGEPYIGIGGLVGVPTNLQIAWLDQVFTMLTDKQGQPLIKTHGFGIATFDLLKRYPWTTCDATSWALGAAFGGILVPSYRGGKPDYAESPIKITVSEADRKKNGLPADHFLLLGPGMKERVSLFLEGEVGVNVAEAAKEYETRARAIVYFMLQFQDAIGNHPFRHRLRGLMGDEPSSISALSITQQGTRLVFATWANAEYQGRILTEEDARRRLLSYWELRDLPAGLLEEYAQKGKAGKRKKATEISIPETE